MTGAELKPGAPGKEVWSTSNKTSPTYALLEKFWRISLYVTEDAIAKHYVT